MRCKSSWLIVKRFLAVIASAIILSAVAGPAVAGTIAVLGDSLSSGYGLEAGQSWVALLEQRLDSQHYDYDVVNASIAGDTSAGGLARLPRVLERHQPDIVILEIGGNDGLRGQSAQQLQRNLASMIRLATDAGARVLLLGIRIPPNYGPSYTKAFAAVYPELAEELHVPLVGFMLEGVALHPDLMQADGVHPNAKGQVRAFENIWPILKPMLR